MNVYGVLTIFINLGQNMLNFIIIKIILTMFYIILSGLWS